MLNVPVIFETITPLFTGNCNQEMTEIKPTSVMGSLRFWFEVICHFSGLFMGKKSELVAKNFKSFIKNKPDANSEDIQKEFKLSPTAFYFGCTGWKSQIGIEKIEPSENEIVLMNPKNRRIVDGKNWYLPGTYFEGQFTIFFSLSDISLKDNILFPLLQFIQEYGFLGGKNNLGFGRVKITDDIKTELSNDSFKFRILNQPYTFQVNLIEKSEFHDANYNYKKFDSLCSGITYLLLDNQSKNYMNNIKRLLKVKSKLRDLYNNDEEKQKLFFGSVITENVQATKIIPLIRQKERGFLAIPGIIAMEETSNEKQ